eukprot:scaffold423339_cov37-Prasinocladus_malaysianus.AAC.1
MDTSAVQYNREKAQQAEAELFIDPNGPQQTLHSKLVPAGLPTVNTTKPQQDAGTSGKGRICTASKSVVSKSLMVLTSREGVLSAPSSPIARGGSLPPLKFELQNAQKSMDDFAFLPPPLLPAGESFTANPPEPIRNAQIRKQTGQSIALRPKSSPLSRSYPSRPAPPAPAVGESKEIPGRILPTFESMPGPKWSPQDSCEQSIG